MAGAARQAAADELTVWLPSAPDGPQPAPELIRPAEADGVSRARWPALGCWRVPALAVEPSAALSVLAALDRLADRGEPLARRGPDGRAIQVADRGEPLAVAAAGRMAGIQVADPGKPLAAAAASRMAGPIQVADRGEPLAVAAAGTPAVAGELAALVHWRPGDRWPTGPRWPGSRMTWPPGAGCCPPWFRRLRFRPPRARLRTARSAARTARPPAARTGRRPSGRPAGIRC